MLLGTAKIFLTRIFQTLIAAGTSVLLARLLGVESYGGYIYVLTVISTLVVPVQFGVSQLVIREIPQASNHSEDVGQFLRWALGLTLKWLIVSGLILAAALHLLDDPPTRNLSGLAFLAVLLLLGLTLMFFFAAILSGYHQTEKEQLFLNVLRPSAFLILIVVLSVAVGSGSVNARLVLIAQSLATLIVIILLCRVALKNVRFFGLGKVKSRSKSRWLRSVVLLMTIGGIDVLLQSSDILMLGAIATNEDVAIYRVGAVLAGLLSLPLSAASTYASPRIASAKATNDKAELQRQCIHIARVSTAVTGALLAAALFFGGHAITFAYGQGFAESFTITLALGAGSIVNVLMGLNRAVLTMNGHETIVFRTMAWTSLVNVGLNAVAIFLFGAVGAAIATSLSVVIWNIWLHSACNRTLGYSVGVFSIRLGVKNEHAL